MTQEVFEEKYIAQLNDQQHEAVRAVDGAVLLLALPGSGKATVLVTRLGYMVYYCGIDPASILTMTYTVAATGDMKKRFASRFGTEYANRLEFRTINGVSSKIIQYYSENHCRREAFALLNNEGELNRIVRQIYQDVNEEYAQYIKCNLKFTDGTYTVGGLETTQTFDAFSGLTVNFEGTSPNGYVEFEYNGDKLSSGDFYCEDAAGLKNGDEIVVSLYQQEASYYVNNYGMIPESLNKTYTVSGLDEYVEDFSDISEDAVSELKSESEDIITAYAAQNFNDENSLKDLEYAGYVINTAKTPEDAYTYNMLFIIYKGDVTNSEGEFSKTTVYYPVAFTNVVSSEGGDVDYETGGEIYGYSYIGGTSYSTTGYTDPYTCYMNIATAYADDYNLASGDGFEAYSEYEDIEKLSDISKSYKKTLQEDAKDRIESYASSEYDGMLKFKKYSVAGEYLLVAKDLGTDFASNNKYVIVYSVKVSSTNDSFKGTKTLYVPVQYDGLIKLGDDDYMVSAVEGILGKSGVEYERYYYTSESIGYADQEDMFNEIISANRDNYTYSVSGDLKDYGK